MHRAKTVIIQVTNNSKYEKSQTAKGHTHYEKRDWYFIGRPYTIYRTMLFSKRRKRRVRRNERFFDDVLFLIFSFRFWQGFFFKVVRNYEGFVNETRHNQAKKKNRKKRSVLIASQATSVAFILLLRSLDPVGEKWVKWALHVSRSCANCSNRRRVGHCAEKKSGEKEKKRNTREHKHQLKERKM